MPKLLDWITDAFAGGSKLITKRDWSVWRHIEIGVEIDMPLHIPVKIWMHLDSFNFGWQGTASRYIQDRRLLTELILERYQKHKVWGYHRIAASSSQGLIQHNSLNVKSWNAN